jgi:hypothetical protein
MARTTWTLGEYLAQGEFYFSESAQEQVSVGEMAPQYALNAYSKLLREIGCDFANTALGQALAARISPGMDELREGLSTHGRVRFVPTDLSDSGARSRLRRAGAVRTHKDGPWIVGETDNDLHVTVRKVKR